MNSIALYGSKGGVAKTTASINLAAAVAAKKKNVLVLDCGPQASATRHLGVEPSQNGMASILFAGASAEECAVETSVPRLHLVPASNNIAAADLHFAATQKSSDRLIKNALAGSRRRYDFVIADCAPSANIISAFILRGFDWFIVPTIPSYLDLNGVANAIAWSNEMPNAARLLGVLITKFDKRKGRSHGEYLKAARKEFPTLKTTIPLNVKLETALSLSQTIFQHAPKSPGAIAYRALANEVMRKTS
jgi:chromosome partitioning protein